MNNFDFKGLTADQVEQSRLQFGTNRLDYRKESGFWIFVLHVVKDPMVVLLLVSATLYFINGDIGDGIFLLVTILFVIAISTYQNTRSKTALQNLTAFQQPTCKVIRHEEVVAIKAEEVVVGDLLLVEEGALIVADAEIIQSNDFSVSEAILTGESLAVEKWVESADHYIYSGTLVASGLAIARVLQVGNATRLGKIGKSLESIGVEKTPLEQKISAFVKWMAWVGVGIFILVWVFHFVRTNSFMESLMLSLTLAMSILPEEIPVAFTSFMALGSWRLMKMGIVVKQMKTVETLGSATVICIDKTGTITENNMALSSIYELSENARFDFSKSLSEKGLKLLEMAMWASEPLPFDPMEKAIHERYSENTGEDLRKVFRMVHEYPLAGKPPLMTHVFERDGGDRIIAVKGAPEALINLAHLSLEQKELVESVLFDLSSKGLRILAVGFSTFEGEVFPELQEELPFQLLGLIAFYDPPKKNISHVLKDFYRAGIAVKIVTGDKAETTRSIAQQIGFKGSETSMSGEELVQLSELELQRKVREIAIFTRMFPEAKLRIINALKAENEIVAMTGDGVNDGPALKAAHIGIAMGKKGTEIAKQAASLILVDDDLSHMVEAVAMGRKIYANLKKAIQYIISIHIPIILTVFIPLAFGWVYPAILSPVHVIFLELIMGPTCSIVYENEPLQGRQMESKPKPFSTTFFNWKELSISILKGIMITVATLAIYGGSVWNGNSEVLTRTLVFTVLIAANVFLTISNRSDYDSLFTILRYKNKMVPLVLGISLVLAAAILVVPSITHFFELQSLSVLQLLICISVGFASVAWYEPVKAWKRMQAKRR